MDHIEPHLYLYYFIFIILSTTSILLPTESNYKATTCSNREEYEVEAHVDDPYFLEQAK